MKKYILLLCISVLLNSTTVNAQASLGITVDSTFSIPNDTFAIGSNINFNVWVKNYGPGTFYPTTLDTFQVIIGVRDSVTFSNIHVHNITNLFDSLPVGDSTSIMLNTIFNYDPSNGYHKDINVIVIWPYASGTVTASIADSLEFPIYLEFVTGLDEIDASTLLSVFPNPTTDYLSLENKGKSTIEEVRIMDASGKLVATLQKPTKIETKSWIPGMYLVHVVLANKQSKTIRVIKR